MKYCAQLLFLLTLATGGSADAQYLGDYSANEYAPNSTSNPYGAGSPYDPNSVNNRYGRYGSLYSNQSANNPYATDAPKLYVSALLLNYLMAPEPVEVLLVINSLMQLFG